MQTSTRQTSAVWRTPGPMENPGNPSGNELGDFLRARRADLDPHDAGLPTTAARAGCRGCAGRNWPSSRT
ncbi:hypothetical protein ACWGJV_37605 [Streptomyces tendae]